MNWWDCETKTCLDGLTKAIEQINVERYEQDDANRYMDHARAIEKLANRFAFHCAGHSSAIADRDDDTTISRRFADLSASVLTRGKLIAELQKPDWRNLIAMPKMIHNERKADDLRKAPNFDPLTEDELDAARTDHKSARDASQRFAEKATAATADHLARTLSRLLFLIRCNITHGDGKRPFLDDAKAVERNKLVISLGLPAIRRLTDLALDSPSRRLAVYGTLRRGHQYHEKIQDLASEGDPESGIIRGHLTERGKLKFLKVDPDGGEHGVEVYDSDALSSDRWVALDRFERSGYRRSLAPVEMSRGTVVCNVYVETRARI